uniref:Methyltransf_25 domain-containing protein n=1 Tax=Steinernema glaseri TaxID=37863 RepID=A0A1I7Y086_9BILA
MAASFAKTFCKLALRDVARQYAHPVKSFSGSFLTRMWARQSRPLEEFAVSQLSITPDDNVLEIGYGRGHGIAALYDRVADGKGIAFGLEQSEYMEDVVRRRFVLETAEEHKVHLDRAIDLRHLPYPSDFFAAVFHVNTFYFWKQEQMREILWELARTVRPGGQLICVANPRQLKKLYNWETVTEAQCNLVRYLSHLESVGFDHVKVEYHQVGRDEIQLVSALKTKRQEDEDPEARMKELEEDIKMFMVEELIRQKGRAGTTKMRNPELQSEGNAI